MGREESDLKRVPGRLVAMAIAAGFTTLVVERFAIAARSVS
jgi:hypothetical protein